MAQFGYSNYGSTNSQPQMHKVTQPKAKKNPVQVRLQRALHKNNALPVQSQRYGQQGNPAQAPPAVPNKNTQPGAYNYHGSRVVQYDQFGNPYISDRTYGAIGNSHVEARSFGPTNPMGIPLGPDGQLQTQYNPPAGAMGNPASAPGVVGPNAAPVPSPPLQSPPPKARMTTPWTSPTFGNPPLRTATPPSDMASVVGENNYNTHPAPVPRATLNPPAQHFVEPEKFAQVFQDREGRKITPESNVWNNIDQTARRRLEAEYNAYLDAGLTPPHGGSVVSRIVESSGYRPPKLTPSGAAMHNEAAALADPVTVPPVNSRSGADAAQPSQPASVTQPSQAWTQNQVFSQLADMQNDPARRLQPYSRATPEQLARYPEFLQAGINRGMSRDELERQWKNRFGELPQLTPEQRRLEATQALTNQVRDFNEAAPQRYAARDEVLAQRQADLDARMAARAEPAPLREYMSPEAKAQRRSLGMPAEQDGQMFNQSAGNGLIKPRSGQFGTSVTGRQTYLQDGDLAPGQSRFVSTTTRPRTAQAQAGAQQRLQEMVNRNREQESGLEPIYRDGKIVGLRPRRTLQQQQRDMQDAPAILTDQDKQQIAQGVNPLTGGVVRQKPLTANQQRNRTQRAIAVAQRKANAAQRGMQRGQRRNSVMDRLAATNPQFALALRQQNINAEQAQQDFNLKAEELKRKTGPEAIKAGLWQTAVQADPSLLPQALDDLNLSMPGQQAAGNNTGTVDPTTGTPMPNYTPDQMAQIEKVAGDDQDVLLWALQNNIPPLEARRLVAEYGGNRNRTLDQYWGDTFQGGAQRNLDWNDLDRVKQMGLLTPEQEEEYKKILGRRWTNPQASPGQPIITPGA